MAPEADGAPLFDNQRRGENDPLIHAGLPVGETNKNSVLLL